MNKIKILEELTEIRKTLNNIDLKLYTIEEYLGLKTDFFHKKTNESKEEELIEKGDISRLFKKMNIMVDSKSLESSVDHY